MRRFLTVILFFSAIPLSAQNISVSITQLNFGNVFTDSTETLKLTIYNNGLTDVLIIDINSYKPEFTISDTTFIISSGSSDTIDIFFNPLHNIFYNSELVIIPELFTGNLSVDMIGTGVYSDTYYSSTQNLSEENLKIELKDLIDNHNSLGYDNARDEMFMMIDNEMANGQNAGSNTLECAYTGREAVGYIDRQDCQTNDNFNTEHTFPQSTFGSAEPMKSDLFHLFPTDENANNVRSNHPFGYVSSPTWTEGGSEYGSGIFEPRDLQKGKTARAMLYFLIRYQNYSNFVSTADEQILVDWCELFQPDSIEQKRNEDIYSFQNNRNPFIDHPEFCERIHSFIFYSQAPTNKTIISTSDTIDFGAGDFSTDHLFNLVLVNDGNDTIHLDSIYSANQILTIDPANNFIMAGEELNMTVRLSSTNNGIIQDQLIIGSDATNQGVLEIPVIAINTFSSTHNFENNISVYPNPADEFVHFDFKSKGELRIFNLNSHLILEQEISADQFFLDTGKIENGFYFIRYQTDHQILFSKLLIAH